MMGLYPSNIQLPKTLCIGYSPGWRQLWAYNTHETIISRVLYAHNCLQTGLCVFYTMVTQKYAIKSHCCQVETIVLSQLALTVKTVKIQLDDLVARH